MAYRLASACALWLALSSVGYAGTASTPSGQPVPATDEEIIAIRAGLQDRALDIDSAKFKDVLISHSSIGAACGKINAKNLYGAYAGYQKFQMILLYNKGTIKALPMSVNDAIATNACQKLGM